MEDLLFFYRKNPSVVNRCLFLIYKQAPIVSFATIERGGTYRFIITYTNNYGCVDTKIIDSSKVVGKVNEALLKHATSVNDYKVFLNSFLETLGEDISLKGLTTINSDGDENDSYKEFIVQKFVKQVKDTDKIKGTVVRAILDGDDFIIKALKEEGVSMGEKEVEMALKKGPPVATRQFAVKHGIISN